MCEGTCPYKIIGTVLQCFMLAFSILIWVFSNKIYFDADVTSAIAKDLKDNFYGVPITNFTQQNPFYIEVKKENENNELRYLKESLGINYVNFGKWQGTVKGCGKKKEDGSTTVRRLETDEACKTDEVFLDSIEPVDIGNYSGIIISKSTVGKNYYQLLMEDEDSVITKNENCLNNKKSCGYIDTLENQLCIEKDSDCPINYIYIDNKEPESIKITNTIYGNGKNMYISNDPYNNGRIPYIIGNFKLADT